MNRLTEDQAVRLLKKELEAIAQAYQQARHTAAGDFDAMLSIGALLTALADANQRALASWAVLAAHRGASWKQIGTELGMTKQGAHKRYGALFEDQQLPGIDS